jgi:hypothetical protein
LSPVGTAGIIVAGRPQSVVAPRQSPSGLGLGVERRLDALAEAFEIDCRRVFLV